MAGCEEFDIVSEDCRGNFRQADCIYPSWNLARTLGLAETPLTGSDALHGKAIEDQDGSAVCGEAGCGDPMQGDFIHPHFMELSKASVSAAGPRKETWGSGHEGLQLH